MPVTNYIWDPETDAYLMEADGSDQTNAVYTNEPVQWGSLVSQRRGSETSYYHQDGLGNTRELTNASEVVTDTNLYDAWGVNVDSTGTTENPFKWRGRVGYYRDVSSDEYYVRARTYQRTAGRWMSADPLLFVDGMNLFAAYFVPNLSDPSGLDAILVDEDGNVIQSEPGQVWLPVPPRCGTPPSELTPYLPKPDGSPYSPYGPGAEACCGDALYNPETHCCETIYVWDPPRQTVVSKVPIWVCERNLDLGGYWGGAAACYLNWKTYNFPQNARATHSYICCDGPNITCYGKQSYNKAGDDIPREKATGDCVMKMVCPSVKRSKCSFPKALTDYSILDCEACHGWAWKDIPP